MKKLFFTLSSTLQRGLRGGLLFLALMATTCLLAEDFSVDGIYYNYLDGNNVKVTYRGNYSDSYDNEYSGAVTIPASVTYNGTTYSVTSIGGAAFYNCSSLTSVTIPNSVTSIGAKAFYECTSLASITIPNSVTSIDTEAFRSCSSLTSLTIPNSVTSIGLFAFGGCTSLTSITIPNSVTSIGKYAFISCSSLTSVTIGNSVTSIGYEAFYGCSSLTSVTIGNSVTSIGDYAFRSCSSLTSITIPNSVTSIGKEAFYACSSLTKTNYTGDIAGWCDIKFGNSSANPISYSHNFFINDQEIKDLVIPNSVTSIGFGAFYGCTSLTSITIPNSVTSIGNYAFSGCIFAMDNFINNSSLDAEANNYWGAEVGDVEIDGLLIRNNTLIYCRPYVTTAVIPESVTSIGDEAFYSCSSLSSVTIPNSVTRIGNYAFYNCSSLTSITIPNSVTSIGEYAFYGCSSLTSITIPNSVTSIREYAFYGCSSLTSITIPNSVMSIRKNAFQDCSSLHSVTINSDDIVNRIYSYDSNISHIFGSQVTKYIIGDEVTGIGSYAFYNCSSLTSITIGNSVTSIGFEAFYECTSLTSITIPNSVTSIGSWAFCGCTSLTSITIPNSVTSIVDGAFVGCSKLTSVTINSDAIVKKSYSKDSNISHIFGSQVTEYIIGESVRSIGSSAFRSCSKLTSITIPNSVTSIGNNAFYGCSSLTSVTINSDAIVKKSYSSDSNISHIFGSQVTEYIIGESVTIIGYYAFSGCSSLTSITIPNSVTSIRNYAFVGCSSLTSPVYNAHCFAYLPTSFEGAYTIPDGIKQIAGGAFYDCSSLTSITIPNSVTSIGDEVFAGCSSLTSITIPNSITSIGFGAFQYCSSLTSPVYNAHCFAYLPTSFEGAYTIPDGIKQIAGGAFYDCSSLTSITIPNSVTNIGDYAFRSCSSLTSITCEATIPPTVGVDAFYGVSKSIPVYVPCGQVDAYKAKSGWEDFTNIQELLAEYSIEVDVNDTRMGSAKVDWNRACGNQISATPNFGYHFVQWSDGNTDNPRTLVLTQDTILTAEFAQSFSGRCGNNLYWAYNESDQSIAITGTGDMYDYTATTQPWLLFKEQIMEVTTSSTATSIGTSAFEGCTSLGKLFLGTGMESIKSNAFAGCRKLVHVNCYGFNPPIAETTSFANYNVYLNVPCDNLQDYQLDMVFGSFKYIQCMGADSENVPTDDVVVTPGINDVTITWPTDKNANTYSIEIKRGDVVFCTLTFSKDGMLTNISFAPSRSGSHPVTYAASTGNGLRFTVTSLDAATTYGYNVTTKDEEDNTLSTYTGEFTTKSNVTTDMDNIQSPVTTCQKIFRNGQLVILRDGKTYTTMGAEIQ